MSGLSFPIETLTLAIGGLGGSGYFLLILGGICGGLGIYFRRESLATPPPTVPTKKNKKNKKSKKNKKQDHVPKKKAEGGSLIWGGLALGLLGIGMVTFDLMR